LKKINKILIIFFLFSSATIYAGWIFIHSKKFSESASKKVSEILTKKFGAKLKFEQVAFGMFPPSTTFKKVSIQKDVKDKFSIDIGLDEFEVSFSYASFISSSLDISEIVLRNGSINVGIVHDEKEPDFEWRKLKLTEIFKSYDSLYSKSPVKLDLLKFENINTKIDKIDLNLNELSIYPSKNGIKLNVYASKINSYYEIPNINLAQVEELKAQINLSEKEWTISRLDLKDLNTKIGLTGKLFQDKSILKISSNLNIITDLSKVRNYLLKSDKIVNQIEGLADLKVKLDGHLFNPDFESQIVVNKVSSPWAKIERVEAKLSKKKNILSLLSFNGKNLTEKYDLLKSSITFDLNRMAFINGITSVELTNAFTNTFLYVIQKSLNSLKGYVTARIDIIWNGEKILFNIKEKSTIKDFKLAFEGSNRPLLQNDGFTFLNSTISLDKKLNVGFDLKVEMPNSLLKVNGVLGDKDLSFVVLDSKIDLKSFGPIGGVKITGSGPVNMKITGPYDDVKFDFDVDWKNFSVVDLNFGSVKSLFSLSLKDVILSIEKLNGNFANTNFDANGWLKFGDNSGLDIKLNFLDTNFKDARGMYGLVFNGMKLPKDLGLKFETHYRVYGDYDLSKLKVEGAIKGRELHVYGEDFDTVNTNFQMANKELVFKNIKIRKGRGEIAGNANIFLANSYTEIEANGSGLKLSDFNFYNKFKLEYDGEISMEYEGSGSTANYSSRLKFKTNDPYISNYPASNSSGLIYLNFDEIVAKLNLLAGKIKLDSIYDFNSSQVYIKSSIDTPDLKELLGVFSGHNMNDKSISGNIKANLNTKFNADTLDISRFSFNLNQFKLKRGDVELKIDPTKNSINVVDGIVKNWNLKFSDGKDFFESIGRNASDKSIILDQKYSIKSNILEIISSYIEKAKGIVKGENQVIIANSIKVSKFNLHSENSSLKIKNVPSQVTSLNYDIVKNGNRFEITKFESRYAEGDLKISGYVLFEGLFPTLNLDFKLDKASIPLFKKSNILVSSVGTITGIEFPYRITGKTTLLHGEILDDPSEIMTSGKVNLDEFSRYLPTKSESTSNGVAVLNMSFDTQNNIIVKNKLAEVYLKAQGQLTGNVISPDINTRIEAQPIISKFKFKGHDFILSQGCYVEIHDRDKNRSSDLKFVGITKVNDYEIKLDLSGKLDKVNIALSSEPTKGQEDILSLLTLGVTSEMNQKLGAEERNAITRLGIGTTILDQLNVNEDLNTSIGVNLSVQPEFQEDESSIVSGGKSALGDSSTSKLKSATKIKLSKPITNKIDVSVSSTVGGSIEQKQEMNINWSVNKLMSVEGVYEIKPAQEDSSSTPSSIGADLKLKWSFK
jgi:translocation and assembly module TamB